MMVSSSMRSGQAPGKVSKVIQRGRSLKVVIESRQVRRCRWVATSEVKRFHPGHIYLGYSMADDFSQHARSADCGLAKPPTEPSLCRLECLGIKSVWLPALPSGFTEENNGIGSVLTG